MAAQHDPNFTNGIVRAVGFVSPNLPIFLLMMLGFFGESILLGWSKDGPAHHGFLIGLTVTSFLLWFWFSVGWGLWAAATTLRGMANKRARILLQFLFAIAVFLASILYVGSWGLYLRAGRFGDMESIRFALSNTRMLWLYLLQAERRDLMILLCLIAAVLGGLPLYLRWVVRARDFRPHSPSLNRLRRILGYVLLFSWLVMYIVIVRDPSRQRLSIRRDLLGHRLNPVVTLLVSGKQSLTEERVSPCLDTATLKPIRRDAWKLPTATNRTPSIIFAAIESLRHDVIGLVHQGREVTPHLNRLAREGLILSRAYTQSSHSDYADVCIFTSTYPLRTRRHHYYQLNDPWPKTLVYDLLKPAGYAAAIVSSQNEDWGAMANFLQSPNLDLFYDAERSGAPTHVPPLGTTGLAWEVKQKTLRAGKLDDAHTTERAIAWVREQAARHRPFFLGMNLQSSHFPYHFDPGATRPFQPCTFDFEASFLDYPVEKTDVVRNAFYNAIHYCDQQLGRLVDALRELGELDNTILVVYGDNGEAFHELGLVTHAREPIEPVVHIACVIRAPNRFPVGVEEYPVELIDIVPTIFGRLGWPAHPNFQGLDFQAADRPPPNERLLFIHTESPISRTDAVLLGGRWKYCFDRVRGNEALFDLSAPGSESENVAAGSPEVTRQLGNLLALWRSRQLAYHQFPFYYLHYYPPPPPRWEKRKLNP